MRKPLCKIGKEDEGKRIVTGFRIFKDPSSVVGYHLVAGSGVGQTEQLSRRHGRGQDGGSAARRAGAVSLWASGLSPSFWPEDSASIKIGFPIRKKPMARKPR